MSPRRQPEQQAPPVERVEVRYAKRGRARFASHRDFHRALERALRRAGVPMAYSSGFNPHPRISFANACPTGAASEAEYLELGLRETCDREALRARLDAALPDGLDVLDVVDASPGGLAARLTASVWRLDLPGVPREVLEHGVTALLATPAVEVERMTKAGVRAFDARAAIIRLTVDPDGSVSLVAAHGAPLVRPDDVVSALGAVEPACVPTEPALLTRLAQGRWHSDRMVGPFEDAARLTVGPAAACGILTAGEDAARRPPWDLGRDGSSPTAAAP